MSATNSLLSANLRSHGRRYISTGLAVAISTAFIVITLIVMAAMTSSLTSGVYSQYQGGTIVVSQATDAPEGAIERACTVGHTIDKGAGIRLHLLDDQD